MTEGTVNVTEATDSPPVTADHVTAGTDSPAVTFVNR
jgi:hypothetical protein